MRGFAFTFGSFVAAQAELAGASGWAGAGMLGLVLAWVFFVRLPQNDRMSEAKDKLFKDLIEGKDQQIKELITDHRTQIKELSAAKDAAVADVVKSSAEQFREERAARKGMHADDRADREALDHRLAELSAAFVARIERAEGVFSKEIQDTRHRLGNVENGLTGVLEQGKRLLLIVQQRTRAADMIESTEDAIWSKTLQGIITSWNPAAERLLGWRRTEVIGQSVYTIVPTDLHAQEKDTLERVGRGESVQHYRTARLHKDGHRVELSATVSPVVDPGGKVVGVSSITREV